jgi:16S rRNA (guanine527-N7)-methyltransferase
MMRKVKLPLPGGIEGWIDSNLWLLKMLQSSKAQGFIGKSTNIRDAVRHSIGYAVVIDYILGFGNEETESLYELNDSSTASIESSDRKQSIFSESASTASISQESKHTIEHNNRCEGRYDIYVGEHGCKIIDVGTGGGLPGIPVADYLSCEHSGMQFTLLDASLKRTNFLKYALSIISNEEHNKDVVANISTINMRAELFGRESLYRGSFQFIITRSLARPATTVELCSPLIQPGGYLIVSLDRHSMALSRLWPDEGLEKFGMAKDYEMTVGEYSYLAITQASVCPDIYPRRMGVPSKKPVW